MSLSCKVRILCRSVGVQPQDLTVSEEPFVYEPQSPYIPHDQSNQTETMPMNQSNKSTSSLFPLLSSAYSSPSLSSTTSTEVSSYPHRWTSHSTQLAIKSSPKPIISFAKLLAQTMDNSRSSTHPQVSPVPSDREEIASMITRNKADAEDSKERDNLRMTPSIYPRRKRSADRSQDWEYDSLKTYEDLLEAYQTHTINPILRHELDLRDINADFKKVLYYVIIAAVVAVGLVVMVRIAYVQSMSTASTIADQE